MLINALGYPLKRGIHVGPDVINRQSMIYSIEVDGDTFSARGYDGFVHITNFEDAAKNFTPLSVPLNQVRFLNELVEIE